MVAYRRAVRPVEDAALLVPFVFAGELHQVALRDAFDPWRHVDVVRDQERPATGQPKQEALVPVAVPIVGQDAYDLALSAHLQVAEALRVGPGEQGVPIRSRGRLRLRAVVGWPAGRG